jgi:hypothetical protein
MEAHARDDQRGHAARQAERPVDAWIHGSRGAESANERDGEPSGRFRRRELEIRYWKVTCVSVMKLWFGRVSWRSPRELEKG